jgi:hypothetical protein
MIEQILPKRRVPWLLAEVAKDVNISELDEFTESLSWL